MTRFLLGLLCDPVSRSPLTLTAAEWRGDRLESGLLTSPEGRTYPVVRGIPRFAGYDAGTTSVSSFGDQWNHFNFVDFEEHWLKHTVANTFGTTEVFRDKVIVDAGGGSGSQTLWMLQRGAKHVVLLDLSHSVDDVVPRNLLPSGFTNYDVVQCSIDAPPLRPQSIDGMVICHNVIQHTPSVEATARALFDTVAPGGEFVFNCYPLHDEDWVRWIRFHLVYRPLRRVLSRLPFRANLAYARLMGGLRLVPGLGTFLEKSMFCSCGETFGTTPWERVQRRYRATVLNTFDMFGSHAYQHHKRESEIRALVASLQADPAKVLNVDRYFSRPTPIGCALRVQR